MIVEGLVVGGTFFWSYIAMTVFIVMSPEQRYGTVQYSAVQYSAVRYSAVQYSASKLFNSKIIYQLDYFTSYSLFCHFQVPDLFILYFSVFFSLCLSLSLSLSLFLCLSLPLFLSIYLSFSLLLSLCFSLSSFFIELKVNYWLVLSVVPVLSSTMLVH